MSLSELDAWIEANGDEEERQERRLSKAAGNWITGELIKHLKIDNRKISDLKLTAENFAELVCLRFIKKKLIHLLTKNIRRNVPKWWRSNRYHALYGY
jgi:Asp-tRNA(Asn)/Glu-tRNA(Gln) amidotransferase B subunit